MLASLAKKKKKNAGGERINLNFFFFIFKILIIKTDLQYHNKFKIIIKSKKNQQN